MTAPLYPESLVTNTYGRMYWIYSNDSFYIQRVANAGPYQKKNLIRLRDLRPQARTVIDVGANIGMNTIEYATWAKEVHSFEPTTQTYDMLQRTVFMAQQQGNSAKGWYKTEEGVADTTVTGKITMYPLALSSECGTSQIVIKKDNAGHNHLENLHLPTRLGTQRKRPSNPPTEEVSLRTLDSYNFTDVDIIKIDVEGHEFDVIKGAEQTILKYRPVVQVEMVEQQTLRFAHSCQEIYDWFHERDYVATLSNGKLAGRYWHKFTREMERFFIHKSEAEGLELAVEEDVPDRASWNYEVCTKVFK